MGKYTGFIVLALILIKIVASILQAARKQHEKQRATEAAAKRRAMEQAGGAAGPVIVARESQPSVPIGRPPDRHDDLEARRRVQIEQLRQRREGLRTGVAMPQRTSARAGAGMQTPPVAQRGMSVSPPMGTSDQARSRAREAETRVREQEREQREQQRNLAGERQQVVEQRSRREREARERRETAQQAKAAVPGVGLVIGHPGISADRTGAVAAAVARQLHQPTALRDMIILREVLDRPLALRNPAE